MQDEEKVVQRAQQNDPNAFAKLYDEYFDKRVDPRNRTYYWHGHDSKLTFDNPDIDGAALDENFISITPIKCDMTDYNMLDDLKRWGIDKETLAKTQGGGDKGSK